MRKEVSGRRRMQWGNVLENLAIVILAFYPLRHIYWGLDLQDTGYNYANFQYMGTEHMDPMWLFSTYLSNGVGHLLMKLPNGNMLAGINLYTGLFAGALALIGYFFCTRKLKMPKVIAFAGEMTALSLCWCPTASFYNYLTYLFFLISSVLLYLGLTGERKGYLVCAGVFLGANVLVRFSNLPQMGMILAVWAYDILCVLEEKTKYTGKRGGNPGNKSGTAGKGESRREGFWKRTVRHTLWCLTGYAGALAVLFSYIHIRYGIHAYIAGIGRLFAMTDNATDYKPMAMLKGIFRWYWQELYWVARIGVILAGGMALFAIAGWLEGVLARRFQGTAAGPEGPRLPRKNPARQELSGIAGILSLMVRGLWIAVSIAMIVWLWRRGFTSGFYYSYNPIWHPGPVFLMLTMGMALIRILDKRASKEEKLISGMLILILFLTSLGSNNGVFPSLNNLFLAAPYTLWQSWRFLRHGGERHLKCGLALSSFPAKGVLTAFLALCLFQFGVFGLRFAFAEGTGIQDPVAVVDNNPVLRNIKMSPRKARWMTELSAYANENGLQGREVILYGDIPAISYYLQMPSAFNPWSDLDSYSPETMEQDLKQLRGEIGEKGKDKPVIILERTYGLYVTESRQGQETSLLSEDARKVMDADPKWKLLLEFLVELGYEQTFCNEKFAVYR